MGNQGNGIGSVLIKTIFILLGVYVLAINVTLWATSHTVGGEQLHGIMDNRNHSYDYYENHRNSSYP